MSPRRSTPTPPASSRARLSPERVVAAAIALADEFGLADLTIRRLADALEVKPMSIYHHVPNKDAIIDAMVDHVFAEIELPEGDDWRAAMQTRMHSARVALARHPWAPAIMESRTSPGPATLAHHNAVLACFRSAGFSLELTAHAYALVDSYLYGFALQEAGLPATEGEEMHDIASMMSAAMPAGRYPFLEELTEGLILQPGYDFADEFDFGLELLLDGLATRLARERQS